MRLVLSMIDNVVDSLGIYTTSEVFMLLYDLFSWHIKEANYVA